MHLSWFITYILSHTLQHPTGGENCSKCLLPMQGQLSGAWQQKAIHLQMFRYHKHDQHRKVPVSVLSLQIKSPASQDGLTNSIYQKRSLTSLFNIWSLHWEKAVRPVFPPFLSTEFHLRILKGVGCMDCNVHMLSVSASEQLATDALIILSCPLRVLG